MSLFMLMNAPGTFTPPLPTLHESLVESALAGEQQPPLDRQRSWFAENFGPLAVHGANTASLPSLPASLSLQDKEELAVLLGRQSRLLSSIDIEIGGGSAQVRGAIFEIRARLAELRPPAPLEEHVPLKLGQLSLAAGTPRHARDRHPHTPRHQR